MAEGKQITLLQRIARDVAWRARLLKTEEAGDPNGIARTWLSRVEGGLIRMERMLPSGSGIDSGTRVDIDACRPERIVLNMSYHHMNDGGYYDGWTNHTIAVTPSFTSPGFDIRIGGRNRNDIKDNLHEVYSMALQELVPQFDEVADSRAEDQADDQAEDQA